MSENYNEHETATLLRVVLAELQEIRAELGLFNRKVDLLMSQTNQLDTNIAALQAAVTSETTVEQSAITLMNGIPAMITAAVAAAVAAGATPAELAAVSAVATTLTTNSAALAAAVTANTPAASP